eukprot:TRINITY_DN15883_c0_g1_i1.p1 TRINITY_DN15883_c0_g1~~TRINITY_DN15883_c0_g1_i1.p1  ORF type:complete len:1077 (+),score=143.12 TRINITY_DN15883_c0_g1_i1:88-3318(+)
MKRFVNYRVALLLLLMVWASLRGKPKLHKPAIIVVSKNIDEGVFLMIRTLQPYKEVVRSPYYGDDPRLVTTVVNENNKPSTEIIYSTMLFIKFWREDTSLLELQKTQQKCDSVFCPLLLGECCQSNVCHQNYAALLVVNEGAALPTKFPETPYCTNKTETAKIHIHTGVHRKVLYVLTEIAISSPSNMRLLRQSGLTFAYCSAATTTWECAVLFVKKMHMHWDDLEGVQNVVFTSAVSYNALENEISNPIPLRCLSYTTDNVVPLHLGELSGSSIPHLLLTKAFRQEVPPTVVVRWFNTTGCAVKLSSLSRGSSQFYTRLADVLRVVGTQHFPNVLQYALGNAYDSSGLCQQSTDPFIGVISDLPGSYAVDYGNNSITIRERIPSVVANPKRNPLVVLKRPTTDMISTLLNAGFDVYFSISDDHGHLQFILDQGEGSFPPCIVFLQGHLLDTYYQHTTPELSKFFAGIRSAVLCCEHARRFVPLGQNIFPSLWGKYTSHLPAWWNELLGNIKPMDESSSVISYDTGGQFVAPLKLVRSKETQSIVRIIKDLPESVFRNGYDYPLSISPLSNPTDGIDNLLAYTWHFILGEDQQNYLRHCPSESINLPLEMKGLKGKILRNKNGVWTANKGDWNSNIIAVLSGDAKHRYECVAHLQRRKINVWVSLNYATCSNYQLDNHHKRIPCREVIGYYSYLSDPDKPIAPYVVFSHSHIRSWHQPSYLYSAIMNALPRAVETQRFTTLTHRWNSKVWTYGAPEVALEYNELIADLPGVKMNSLVMKYCCAQGIIPYTLIKNVSVDIYKRMFEAASRNLLYSAGWYLEKVFQHSLGDPGAVEMIPLGKDILPLIDYQDYSYPISPGGQIWYSDVALMKKASDTDKILILVVVGDHNASPNKGDSIPYPVWFPSEACTVSNIVCSKFWGFITYMADANRPVAEHIVFVSTLNQFRSLEDRLEPAISCLSSRPGSSYAPLASFGTSLYGDVHSQVVSSWNAAFSDLEYVLTPETEIVSYQEFAFVVSFDSLTYNVAYWTYYLRIWREITASSSSSMKEVLFHYWHILFTWDENFVFQATCWNQQFF